MVFQKIKKTILDAIYPIECASCKKDGRWICDDCFDNLPHSHGEYCLNCKKESPFGKFCSYCSSLFSVDGIMIAGSFRDKTLKKLVKTYKYNFARDISQTLGEYLFLYLNKQISDYSTVAFPKLPRIFKRIQNTLIIPVPLHKKRLRWRGFNQSELLAQIIADKFDSEINTKDLKRIKNSSPQTKLNKDLREKNLIGNFRWNGADLNKKNIILIDDVTTTGATLNECAKELKKNNAGTVWGVVIANG